MRCGPPQAVALSPCVPCQLCSLGWRACHLHLAPDAAPVRMLHVRHLSACRSMAVQTVVPAAQDMHLFFSNIYTYNGTNSNFGKLGSRVEGLFEVSTKRTLLQATHRCRGRLTCHGSLGGTR